MKNILNPTGLKYTVKITKSNQPMITINRNILFPVIGAMSIFAILSIFLNSNNYLLSFLIFTYLVTIPGSLILFSLKMKSMGFWKFSLLSIGLSIFFLMVLGLLFNWVSSLSYYSSPLQKEILAIYYGFLIGLLIIIAYFRNKILKWELLLKPFDFIKNAYFLIPPIFALLSASAATLLNNTGNNILAVTTLSGIAVILLITTIFYKRINKHFFPWSIYFFSLSLLLIISLRSWYIAGWDIQNEFAVFQLTKSLGTWNPANTIDAYNACLSITLLPTIFSKLTAFPDDYIYKILYQILFAITPVIIYQTFKRYAKQIVAYIAVIYIISQPLFIQPMTALMRQEIAFIFFALMFYVLYDLQLTARIRTILFLIFGFGMVVSHYSTTYVALLLLLTTYSFTNIFRLTGKISFISRLYQKIKITDSNTHYRYYLSPLPLIFLFCFTLFWYGFVNNQLGQVQKIASDGIARMSELFRLEVKSGESRKAITFFESDYTTIEEIQTYSQKQLLKVGGDAYRLYPSESYADSNVYPMVSTSVTPVISSAANRYFFIAFEILKQIFKIFVILGPIYLFIRYFRKNTFPREYILFCVFAVFVTAVMIFHPSLGFQYNLSRFYLQLLFYLSLPAILFFLFLLSPVKKYSTHIAGVFIIFLFIYLLGLPHQLLGGGASMYLNNFGSDYDKFYVHKEELVSANWLKENVDTKATLFADREANLRIYRIVSRNINFNVLPALMYKDAYVYGSFANVVNNHASIHGDGSPLLFTFPQTFLENNKNLIYSNGGSEIFK
jgi:uncharacterized membrane protein